MGLAGLAGLTCDHAGEDSICGHSAAKIKSCEVEFLGLAWGLTLARFESKAPAGTPAVLEWRGLLYLMVSYG